MLCEQEIPTPGTLDYMRTGSPRRYYPGFPCKWATNTIVHILSYREYTGCPVNFKTITKSYKCKKILCNDEGKQAVFEGGGRTPIIDPGTWERVQKLREKRRRPSRYGEMSLFSGLLYCADCGRLLYCQRYKGQNGQQQDTYICGNYRKRTHEQRRRIAELDKIIKRLYEDNVTGKISDERYMMFSSTTGPNKRPRGRAVRFP